MEIIKQADVVFALTGDVRRNSRALRQVRALSGHGLQITVLSLDGGGSHLPIPNTHLHLVKTPRGRGPLFFWKTHVAMAESAAAIRARVYHASDLYVLPAMARAARKHHGRLIYDARELYPHVASTIGRPWARYFWMALEKRYIRRANAVFTVSDSISDKLVEMYGIDRPTVVYNIPQAHAASASGVLREKAGLRHEDTVFLHQGQMRSHRGCELIVDAMRDVDGVLVFLGDGPLRELLQQKAQTSGISNRVRFLDAVPPDELLAYTSGADVGLTLLDDVCLNHRYALPNKLFEYLTAMVPVIASNLPEVRRIIADYDVGLTVDPGSHDDLVAAMRQASIDKTLRERWRRNIPRLLETFNSTAASQAFLHQYDSALLPKS